MSSITQAFADALSSVDRPGDFCVSGTQTMLAPGLAVSGIGPVALPLLAMQARQLIAASERAPYGRGEETVTDIGVRRTWQIGADRVAISGKHWPDTLRTVVGRVAEGLGVTDTVEAQLYKLLIYDEGSFFVPHRDTEKAAGMFATLILVLPSVSEGGALIVRHLGREVSLDLRCEDPSELAFAAFYADCVHEVRPVTSGYRLVLVYNLIRSGAGGLPLPPSYDGQTATVAAWLKLWAAALRLQADDAVIYPGSDSAGQWDDEDDPDEYEGEPRKLIYPLQHAYTPAELGFGGLKGADAGIASVVVAAAAAADCEAYMALVTIEESGSAESAGSYRRSRRSRYDDDDDDDFVVVEIADRQASITEWRRPDGLPCTLGRMSLSDIEFSPPMEFDELEPDEQHFHEATGNEGASFERTYRRAALIVWPRDGALHMIVGSGLSVSVPFMRDLVARWSAGGDEQSRAQALTLAGLLTSRWMPEHWRARRDEGSSSAGEILDLLGTLDDIASLDGFLAVVAEQKGFDIGDAPAIAAALGRLPVQRASVLATHLVENAAAPALAACARLLGLVSATNPGLVTGASRVLAGALPGGRTRAAPASRPAPPVTPSCIADLFAALGRIDATLAAVAADHVLDWPLVYGFDTVLMPATEMLLAMPEIAGTAAVRRLRDACLAHLDARIALKLVPPEDWRRDSAVGCDCQDCRALSVFLAHPGQSNWMFAAAQARRSHVQATIWSAKCDVDTATQKRGSPHQLVCTKNQASYLRRCVQRSQDLAMRDRLATGTAAASV